MTLKEISIKKLTTLRVMFKSELSCFMSSYSLQTWIIQFI